MRRRQIKASKFILKFAVISIILIATFLRFYQLPALPPGLNFDEAGNGVAALEILDGSPRLWWSIGGGKEPFWPYLIALSTLIWGNIPVTLRLPAAFTGILTVAAVYPLMLTFFRRTGHRQAQLMALLTMLGLALSGWHLHFSRLGFRAILLPLLSTLAFYFFWKSLAATPTHSKSTAGPHLARRKLPGLSAPLALSGLFAALASYAYLAARLLPLAPLLFLGLTWLISRIRHFSQKQWKQLSSETDPAQQSGSLRHLALLCLHFLFATLLFLLPLIIYFLFNPADFAARSGTVSIFNPAWNRGDLIGTAWQTLTATLNTFAGQRGDANPLVNLPGQPALPPILAPFFILGLLAGLYYAWRPSSPMSRRGYSPYLFLLCWWLVMLLPAILAPEGAPHHLRLIGTIVPTYALVALGLVVTAHFIFRLLSPASRHPKLATGTVYLLLAACYLLVAIQTYTGYFITWPARVDFTLPFDLYAVRLADDFASAPALAAYIRPMDIRAGAEARHYTLDYLLGQDRSAPYVYLPVDEQNAETILPAAARAKRELRLVRWTADKHIEADAKEIVTFLMGTNARLLYRESRPVYDVEIYAPDPAAAFKLPAIDRPILANFDNLLQIDAAFVPSTAAPGDWLPVALTLTPLAPMETDYKVSLRLISPAGERIVQKDRILLHNFHQGTSLWPPETVNEYYLLPVPPEAPPGNYTVAVVIYHPDTQAPLVTDGMVEIPVGHVRIN